MQEELDMSHERAPSATGFLREYFWSRDSSLEEVAQNPDSRYRSSSRKVQLWESTSTQCDMDGGRHSETDF